MRRNLPKILAFVLLPIGTAGFLLFMAALLNQDIMAGFLDLFYKLTQMPQKDYDMKWARHYSIFGAVQCFLVIIAGFYAAFYNKASQPRFTESEKEKIRNYVLSICIIGILLCGVLLRVSYYAENRSFWHDPSKLAVALIDVSFSDIHKPLENDQTAPLGFLVLSKIIGMHFDYRELALTFLPFIFGVFSLPAFYLLGNELFKKKYNLIFLSFACFSMAAVYYSSEFKQYSGDLFFSTLIMYFTIRLYNNDFRKNDYIYLFCVGLVAIWFSHAAIIVSAGCGLGLAVVCLFNKRTNRETFFKIVALGAIWLINILANYFFYTRNSASPKKYEYFAKGYAPFPIENPDDIEWYIDTFLGIFSHPLSFGDFLFFFPLIFLIAGLIHTYRNNKDYGILLCFPIIFLFALSLLGKYPFSSGERIRHARLILFISPIFYFFIVQGIIALSEKTRSDFLLIIIFIFMLNHQILQLTLSHFGREEIRPLVSHYMANKKAGDHIYVYSASKWAFRYYTRNSEEQFSKFKFADEDNKEAVQIEPEPPKNGKVWFLLSRAPESMAPEFIDYLDNKGTMAFAFKTPGASLYYYEFSNKDTVSANTRGLKNKECQGDCWK